jgi:hypothetical protein
MLLAGDRHIEASAPPFEEPASCRHIIISKTSGRNENGKEIQLLA